MAAVPPWLLGKHVSAVTLTPQTVAANGTLANTTPVRSLIGIWEEIDVEMEKTVEMIQSADFINENDVITGLRVTLRATEILMANDSSGTPTNLLAAAAMSASDYFLVSVTRGGRTWSAYLLYRTYREELRRGKSLGHAEFTMIDPGAPNLTLT